MPAIKAEDEIVTDAWDVMWFVSCDARIYLSYIFITSALTTRVVIVRVTFVVG